MSNNIIFAQFSDLYRKVHKVANTWIVDYCCMFVILIKIDVIQSICLDLFQ